MANNINIPIEIQDSGAVSKLNSIAAGFDKLKKKASGAIDVMNQKTKSAFGSIKRNGGAVLKSVGIGLGAVVAGAVAAGAAFLSMARDVAKTQQIKKLYDSIPGTFERIRKFATDAGVEVDVARDIMLKFGQNFKPELAEQMFKVVADLGAKAKLPAEDLKALGDEVSELSFKAGVGAGDFEKFQKIVGGSAISFETLAKASGQSLDEVKKQIKEGTFSTVNFAKALAYAGSEGKALGATALEEAPKSIDAQLNKINGTWQQFKENLFTSLGGEEKVAQALGSVATYLQKIISQENLTKVINGIASALKFLADNANIVNPILAALGGILGVVVVTAAYGAATAMAAATVAFIAANAPIIAIGVALGLLVYYFDDIVAGFNNMGDAIGAFVYNKVVPFFKNLPSMFLEFGANIMTGLLDGITSKAKAVIDSVKEVAAGVAAAFKSVLKISSPSKLFEEYGENTAAGYESGLKSSEGAVEASSASLATAAYTGVDTEIQNKQHNINASKAKKQKLDMLATSDTSTGNNKATSPASQMFGGASKPSVTNNNTTSNSSVSKPNIVLNITIGEGAVVDESQLSKHANELSNTLIDALSRASFASST